MGAFFLYKKDKEPCLLEVNNIFRQKGFSEPHVFELGHWVLWLYEKQLLRCQNFLYRPDGKAVFLCGTAIYKGSSHIKTMQLLLEDFAHGTLDFGELVGSYCIIFWDGRHIHILTDPLNVQHVFLSEERNCLSSSFLAILCASGRSLSLNRTALLEKLLTGYIVSPDTLVSGIYRLNWDAKREEQWDSQIRFVITEKKWQSVRLHSEGMEISIRNQVQTLKNYFQAIDALHSEFGGELGLSGGYDARLVLAASKYLSKPIALHTHYTVGVHDKEKSIAEELARISGYEITFIPTRPMNTLPDEELERVLLDNVLFFDARCADGLGAFSETYTLGYRKAVLKDRRLSLNGIGGEIYRNSACLPQRQISFSAWARLCLFYPGSEEFLGSRANFEELKDYILTKMERILQISLRDGVNLFKYNYYYGFLRMPECRGVVNNAYNQVSFFLTPFVEPKLILEALKAVPYLGSNGYYEAKLIEAIWPELASVPSIHGFPFSRIPLNHLLKCWLQASVPPAVRYLYLKYMMDRNKKSLDYDKFVNFVSSSRVMRDIIDTLRDVLSPLDAEKLLIHPVQRRIAIFLGFFLMSFSSKLRYR